MLTIDQIRTVVADYFKDKPVKKVWLFGSYARGEAREDSDVDLLVDYNEAGKQLSYFKLARFLVDLEDKLGTKVDLSEEGCMYPRVAHWVNKERIELMDAYGVG